MPFYTTVERGMLEHVFWKVPYIPALPFYLGLQDDSYNELLGMPGYARVLVASADFNWPMTGGVITNAVPIHFPEATGDWSKKAEWAALYDSNGDPFAFYHLEDHLNVEKGEIPTFGIDALEVEMANFQMSIDYEGVVPGVTGHNAFSNYLKDKLLRHLFGKEVYYSPDIWAGLLTDDPGDVLTNTDCDEVLGNGTGYARVYVNPSDWQVHMAEAWNIAKIEFDMALVDWGTIKHFALFDTYSPLYAGNALFHGPIEPWKVVVAGSMPYFDITIPGTGTGEYDTLGIGFAIL